MKQENEEVEAVYPYRNKEDESFLSFAKGQKITVIKKDIGGWWIGEIENKQGSPFTNS